MNNNHILMTKEKETINFFSNNLNCVGAAYFLFENNLWSPILIMIITQKTSTKTLVLKMIAKSELGDAETAHSIRTLKMKWNVKYVVLP